jgi:hypothetical protein
MIVVFDDTVQLQHEQVEVDDVVTDDGRHLLQDVLEVVDEAVLTIDCGLWIASTNRHFFLASISFTTRQWTRNSGRRTYGLAV